MNRPLAHANLFSRLWPGARRPAARAEGGSARQRALRALAWGAAAFVAATAGLSAALETVLPQIRDPEHGTRALRLRARAAERPDRPLVLVLGTSRTQNAVSPAAMGFPDEPGSPLVFNYGQSGATPLHLRLALRGALASGARPAAVLVELLPATLAEWGARSPTFLARAECLTAADVSFLAPHLADPGAVKRRWAHARLNPWVTHRRALLSCTDPGALDWSERVDALWEQLDGHGFGRYTYERVSDADRERRRGYAFDAHAASLRDLRIDPKTIECVRDLVAEGRAAGAAVAFYFAPESPVYRSWYADAARAEVAKFVALLRDELKCPVFDAPTDVPEEDFADGHHMLPAAAARYSKWLADTHLRPWLAARTARRF